MAKKKALVKQTMSFEDDAKIETGVIDKDSIAIPYIQILQTLSPQIKKGDKKIEGAEEGQFYNSVTELVADAIRIVPCYYERLYNKWKSRESGGGFLGPVSMANSEAELKMTERDDRGRNVYLDNKDEMLIDTRNHYVLVEMPEGTWSKAVISLSSTGIKVSKKWIALYSSLKLDGGNGKYTPPCFSHIYDATQILDSKGDQSWYTWRINNPVAIEDESVYYEAREFARMVSEGTVEIANPIDEDPEDEDHPAM